MRKNVIRFLLLLLLALFLVPNLTLANAIPESIVPLGQKYETGNYELDDLLMIGINVSNIILGVVGSLALLMFVYGGVMMLISSGNTEKVTKAKGIIVAAVVGLVIVFASYIIIRFVMEAFGVSWDGSTNKINQEAILALLI